MRGELHMYVLVCSASDLIQEEVRARRTYMSTLYMTCRVSYIMKYYIIITNFRFQRHSTMAPSLNSTLTCTMIRI